MRRRQYLRVCCSRILQHSMSFLVCTALSFGVSQVILEVNHVDHATVIEKDVLVAMVIDLWRSTQAIESKASTERTCKICFDAPSDCVFLECGMLVGRVSLSFAACCLRTHSYTTS
eukprot:m.54358 g.54358  ORF g.54358 m.54358 type:complete len:116 (-) comp7522_c0_seq1:138-485(-)